MTLPSCRCLPWGPGSLRPISLEPHALFAFLTWLAQPPWDQHPPPPPHAHIAHLTRITLYLVQKGLAVPVLSPPSLVCLWLLCVCMHFHPTFTAYLLSAHYVPGTVAEFLCVP